MRAARAHESIADYAKRVGLSDGVYPVARRSYVYMTLAKLSAVVALVSLLLKLAASFANSLLAPSADTSLPDGAADAAPDALSGAVDAAKEALGGVKSTLADITWTLVNGALSLSSAVFALSIVMTLVFICLYGVTVVKRSRRHERSIVANDIERTTLKRSIVDSLELKTQLREAREAVNDEKGASLQQQQRIDALNAVKSMSVVVNTRESIETPGFFIRRYAIVIQLKGIHATDEQIMQITKSLDTVATGATRGEAIFGEPMLSIDRTKLILEAFVDVSERFATNTEVEHVDNEKYEYVFPLSMFKNNTAENEKIADAADSWATKTGAALDMVLTTGENAVSRLDTIRSGSTVTFTYDMAFTLQMKDFESLGKTIDKVFKTSGTQLSINEGQLLVTMILPADKREKIDVASMYRRAFGDDV